MRFLKVLTIGMGVLIVVATTVLVVVIARRIGGAGPAAASVSVLLDEPRARGSPASPPPGIGWRYGSRVAARTGWCWSIPAPGRWQGTSGCGRGRSDPIGRRS